MMNQISIPKLNIAEKSLQIITEAYQQRCVLEDSIVKATQEICVLRGIKEFTDEYDAVTNEVYNYVYSDVPRNVHDGVLLGYLVVRDEDNNVIYEDDFYGQMIECIYLQETNEYNLIIHVPNVDYKEDGYWITITPETVQQIDASDDYTLNRDILHLGTERRVRYAFNIQVYETSKFVDCLNNEVRNI